MDTYSTHSSIYALLKQRCNHFREGTLCFVLKLYSSLTPTVLINITGIYEQFKGLSVRVDLTVSYILTIKSFAFSS